MTCVALDSKSVLTSSRSANISSRAGVIFEVPYATQWGVAGDHDLLKGESLAFRNRAEFTSDLLMNTRLGEPSRPVWIT